MSKFFVVVVASMAVFGLVLVFAFVFAFVTQMAWDGSVGEVFHLPNLTFFQAFWLNMLGGMVCKASSSGSSE